MNRLGAQLTTAASWALVTGLGLAPVTLGRMVPARDLWAHVLLCLVATAAIVGALLGGTFRVRLQRADALVAALLLAHVAAACVTVYPHGTLLELMRLLDYLALYTLVRVFLRERRMLLAGAIALACGGAACGVLGLQEYLGTALSGDPSWRAFGPFYNPNLLAAMLMLVIPLWLGLARIGPLPALRLAAMVGLAICWLCFFATGSKGGALALMGGLLVGAVLAPDPARGGLAKRAALGVGLVALAGAAALLLPPIRVRVAEAFGPQSNSMMFRYYTWLAAWHMALDRPLLGFGPGTFAVALPRFAIAGHTMLAHQTYLQIAAETGFLGLTALLGALGAQLVSAVRAARRLAGEPRTVAVACAAGMVGFLVHNAVDYAWHVTATGAAFWALAGLVGAAWDCPRDAPPEAPTARKTRRQTPHPAEARPIAWPAVASAVVAGLLLATPAGLLLRAESLAAAGDLEAAAQVDPLNEAYPRQLAVLAQNAAEGGRPELYARAIDEWRAVERLRPTFPGVHYNLGLIAEAQGDTQGALAEYRAAQALAPTWTTALVAEARLLQKLNREPDARNAWRRLDELSETPLFRYRAVVDDLDPNFAWAWLALADEASPDKAGELRVRAATYLRQVLAANRRMEGVWRHSGEWARRQGPELTELVEGVAAAHSDLPDPGPRLRAALLLVDADRRQVAEEFFLRPGMPPAERALFEDVIAGWGDHVAAMHLQAQGRFEAAEALIRTAAPQIDAALASDRLPSLREGPLGWSEVEVAALREPIEAAERLRTE